MSDPQHTAYEVALKARLDAKQAAVHEFLTKVDCYDSEDMDDIDTAIKCVDQAFELCEQAEKIARQMIQSTDHTKAIAELKKRRPGYSDETYAHAMNEAIFRFAR
jgi:tRNA(Glu) U13 pseudouridine synthase TruD